MKGSCLCGGMAFEIDGGGTPIERGELGMVEVPASAIDGDPVTRPARHIFVRGKAPWFEITDQLDQFDEGPDR